METTDRRLAATEHVITPGCVISFLNCNLSRFVDLSDAMPEGSPLVLKLDRAGTPLLSRLLINRGRSKASARVPVIAIIAASWSRNSLRNPRAIHYFPLLLQTPRKCMPGYATDFSVHYRAIAPGSRRFIVEFPFLRASWQADRVVSKKKTEY